jgi:hypothetical protein
MEADPRNMRANGVRSLEVCCRQCHHRTIMSADPRPDHVPVSVVLPPGPTPPSVRAEFPLEGKRFQMPVEERKIRQHVHAGLSACFTRDRRAFKRLRVRQRQPLVRIRGRRRWSCLVRAPRRRPPGRPEGDGRHGSGRRRHQALHGRSGKPFASSTAAGAQHPGSVIDVASRPSIAGSGGEAGR